MPIHLHRSNRVEHLVEALARSLRARLPEDPFDPVPIVVGSRGMERYLRHELATRLGVASALAFPFPRAALRGAAAWLLGEGEAGARFWEPSPSGARSRFEPGPLAAWIVARLRARAGEPAFAEVASYLGCAAGGEEQRPVGARELLFGAEVAATLDRLMHDRPRDALSWAREPSGAGRWRWLAQLLGELGVASDDASPPRVLERLAAPVRAAAPGGSRALHVFGLSTLGPGDRASLSALAPALDLSLYLLAPTREWFADARSAEEYRRAIRGARTPEALARVELDQRHVNPLLASLAAPSRDVQSWLEETGYVGDDTPFEDPRAPGAAPSLLERLQAWVLEARGLEDAGGPWEADPSIAFHSTYGALRQCEVLRDELLRLFAEDPTLEPRDVLVMTPRVGEHAALLAGVLARRGLAITGECTQGELVPLPSLPTHVADLGLAQTNPLAEVLLRLLELGGERLTATRVAALFALAPVRRRFELEEAEVPALEGLLHASGLCWGLDAEDRALAGQPRRDENTARFAMERLALGVAMPDPGGPYTIAATSEGLGPAVPLELDGREAARLATRLLGLLRAIAAVRAGLTGPCSLPAWRGRLVSALDTLAEPEGALAWQRSELLSELDTLVDDSAALGEIPIERAALARVLAGRFERRQRGDRPLTGAVTVCALQPMRSVPFRVIALLGMDSEHFPRGSRPPAWSPLAEPRAGEHDARSTDRHLLLEALLSARERAIFLWSGRDVRQGTARPAAVPVEELLETLGALTATPRDRLVTEHPLQPWSEACFGAPPRSHDAALAAAARDRAARERAGAAPPVTGLALARGALLGEEAAPPRELELRDLVLALYRPQRWFLRDRLGVWLERDEVTLEDREPLDWESALRARRVGERMLEAARAGGRSGPRELAEVWRARLAGEGGLPVSVRQRAALEREAGLVTALLERAAELALTICEPRELAWRSAGGVHLRGRLTGGVDRAGTLTTLSVSTIPPRAHARLATYLHLLLARASGLEISTAALVCPPEKGGAGVEVARLELEGRDREDPAATLEALLELALRGRRTALPLFACSSPAAARVLAAALPAEAGGAAGARGTRRPQLSRGLVDALQRETAPAWRRAFSVGPAADLDSPWVQALFVDWSPAEHLDWEPDGFLDLAWRVWGSAPEWRVA